jgi:peptidoglycan/LPS O-acetylase OafA/YrhL
MWGAPADLPRPVGLVFQAWKRGGWVGVDLFFVLSGFLVSGILFTEYRKRGEISIFRFYVRRGWRIYPAFFFLIAMTLLMDQLWGWERPARELFSELFFLQNYLWTMWGHTWSLAVEEHFYLLLPLLLTSLLWLRRGSTDPFKPLVLVAVFTGTALLVLRASNSWDPKSFSYQTHFFPTHLRIDSLLFGVCVSYAYHVHHAWFRRVFGPHRWLLIAGGIASLAPAFVFQLEKTPFIWTAGLTLFYLGSGALLTGVVLSEVPRTRIAVGLGAIGSYSYSIYLWHMPILILGVPTLEYRLSHNFSFFPRILIYLAGSVVVGVILAWLIEAPALRIRDRWFPALGAGSLPAGPWGSRARRMGTSRHARLASRRLEDTMTSETGHE